MDHFAREDDDLAVALREGGLHRNFQGYTTRAGADICAFGMSAISQTPRSYRQNEKDLGQWRERLRRGELPLAKGVLLSGEDLLRREIIMTIMCSGVVLYSKFNDKYGITFTEKFSDALQKLEEPARDGLVCFHENGFTVTEQGRHLLRNLAMPFDAYLREGARRHAKTV
ncbi:MAG: hypothetical protein GVY10_03370 [Verrucomicrobia bacterium]|nr:hypothetical protein [Verrucomicrobiota bacterium]